MDRLSSLTFLSLLACGAFSCASEESASSPAPSRVVAIAADPSTRKKPEEFCDAFAPAAKATRFVPPPLATGALPSGKKPRWINLWATWCRPCIEEMPLLLRWQADLGKEGLAYDLQFLSVDADDASIDAFRKKQPGTPTTARLASTEALPDLLTSIGLDQNAPIPIQIFLDESDRVRCVRTGAIGDRDLDVVRDVLRMP